MRKITILMVIIFAGLLLAGCGTKPAGVAQVFFDAMQKQQYSTAKMYVSQDTKSSIDYMKNYLDKITDEQKTEMLKMKYAVRGSQVNGVNATVDYERWNKDTPDKREAKTIDMVKEAGQWKVILDRENLI